MNKSAQDFYFLFSNHKFKKVTDVLQDGFSGMYVVLKIIKDAERELSAGDISDIFGVTTARTAVVLTTLEKKEYIIKSKSANDARKTIVKITPKGNKVLEERKDELFVAINAFLSKLNANEIDNLYKIIEKLLDE